MIARLRRPSAALALLACCLLLSACFEDEAEVTFNADGSGSFTHTLTISEQMVYAMEHTPEEQMGGGPAEDSPLTLTEEKLTGMLGDAAKLTEFEMVEQDDLSKVIKIAGTFDDAAAFLASEYARDSLKLSAATVGDQARLTWDGEMNEGGMGPDIDQMYGLAKGMKMKRTVHVPTPVASETGTVDGNSVTWAIDLTSRETLAATKAMLEKAGDGPVTATFALGDLTLPEANDPAYEAEAMAVEADPDTGVAEADAGAVGIKAEVVSVNWTKVARVSAAHPAADSTLSVDVLLTWPDGMRPQSYYNAKLASLEDDQGNNLIDETMQGNEDWRQEIWEHNENQSITLMAQAPDPDAKALRGLEGSVKVVAAIATETATLENPKDLIGKATGHAALDKLGFKIKKISEDGLEVEFKEGVDANKSIKSIIAKTADDTPIDNQGWGGWNNQMTYHFADDPSTAASIEIEVVTGETIVTVPFAVEQVALP